MPQGPLAASIARSFQKALGFVQLDPQGALWETTRHGKYYASVYGTPAIVSPATVAKAGSTFRGANQSAASISVGLATTYTGLCLSNPAGSTVNLSVKKIGAAITTAPSTQIGLGLMAGWLAAGVTVHTTPLNTSILNSYLGAGATGTPSVAGSAPQANLDAACTLPVAPIWIDWLAANGTSGAGVSFFVDADEGIIIPPGGFLAIGSSTVGSQGGLLGSFFWEELAP